MSVKRKLLVIDDDLSICETIRHVAESVDFSVTITTTAKDFREKYLKQIPDCITIDLGLDESDGIELLRFLSANKCKTRLIVISGYDRKVIQSALLFGRSQELNIIEALQKPIDIVLLRALLNSFSAEPLQISRETLLDAIKNKDFMLFYQPKISMVTNKLIGVEALVRWHMNGSIVISPDSFIKIAEDSELIIELSSWINHEAIQQCSYLQKNGYDIMMSINISAKLLDHLSFPDELFNLTKKFNVTPKNICIEITESVVMKNPILALDILTRLRIKDFSLSIDDFGTGYSSLVELQRMPFNELKIDKSFIGELQKDSSKFIIVRSVINLGHDLGLKIVAEGVETLEAFTILKEFGCDIAQGYYIGRPMPMNEFLIWANTCLDDTKSFRFLI